MAPRAQGLLFWLLSFRLCLQDHLVYLNSLWSDFASFPSMPPMPPQQPQFSDTKYLPKLLPFSENLSTPSSSELVRTCPFKIKPSENPKVKLLISYTPWAKTTSHSQRCSKLTEDPRRFAEEFSIVIQIYQPSNSQNFSEAY